MAETRSAQVRVARPWLPRAWWSLVLYPVSLALAFVVGEGIPVLFGYADVSETSPPWWVAALALTAAAVVFAAPLLLTAFFSSRAARQGERGARIPIIVAGAVVGAFVLVNLLSGLMVVLFG